jgi:hypothetical protein
MEQKDQSFDHAAQEALANFGKEVKEVEQAKPEAEVQKEVVKEVKEGEAPKEEVKTEKPETGIPPEKILEELNKLGFKVKGKQKVISSQDELKRLINLGFNYEENARRLNEERQKLKTPPKEEEENPFVDETQKAIEEKIKRVEEYISNIASKETEKELDEAIADLKTSFPFITDEEIDAITYELQNRLELIPQDKEIDLKSLMHSIYLEFNPDAFNKKMQSEIDKKVQEEIDKYKKSLSKNIVAEGGTSGAVKGNVKTPSSYEEAIKAAMEDREILKK